MGRGLKIRGPIRHVKEEIRVLGVAACRFEGKVRILGVVCRGRKSLDGVLMASISEDSPEATDAISNMIKGSPHFEQVRLIVLDKPRMAGIPVDVKRLRESTGLPVIALCDEGLEGSLRGRVFKCQLGGRVMRFHARGVTVKKAREALTKTARGSLPESIRLARILAEAVENLKATR